MLDARAAWIAAGAIFIATLAVTGVSSPAGVSYSDAMRNRSAVADVRSSARAAEPRRAAIRIGIWYCGSQGRCARDCRGGSRSRPCGPGGDQARWLQCHHHWIAWRDAESTRGAYALASVERLIAAAAQNELTVDVRLFVDAPPAWSTSAMTEDRARFVDYARARLRLGAAVTSVQEVEASGDLARTIRVGRNARTPIEARMDFWTAIARGAQRLTLLDTAGGVGPSVLSLGETIGLSRATRGCLPHCVRVKAGSAMWPVKRRARGGEAPRIADALVIVGTTTRERAEGHDQLRAGDPRAIWQTSRRHRRSTS